MTKASPTTSRRAEILAAICESGPAGITAKTLEERFGVSNSHLNIDLSRWRNSGLVATVRIGRIALHLAADQPTDRAVAEVQRLHVLAEEVRMITARQQNKAWRDAQPKAARKPLTEAQLAQRMAALERGWATCARRAVERAMKEAPKIVRRADGRIQSQTRAINRLAAKVRAEALPREEAREPVKVTITWPENVKPQLIPSRPGRYEVLETPGPFSSTRPGQYVFPANSCAAKAAA